MHYLKRLVLFSAVLAALGGCKLTLIADTGGNISSSSGNYECAGGNSCENDIEQSVSDTFTAVADSGYRFVGWSGFCLEGVDAIGSSCSVTVPEPFVETEFNAEYHANFNPLLIGSWIKGSLEIPDSAEVVTFFEDGNAYLITTAFGFAGATNPLGGSARLSYTFDFDAEDGPGEWIYEIRENSIGDAAPVFEDGTTYFDALLPDEESLTLYIRDGGEVVFRRIASGTDEAIQGTWIIGDPSDYQNFSQLTFENGFYSMSAYCDNGPDVGAGLQIGTYEWDPDTGALSVTVLRDTLDGCGLYDMAADEPFVRMIKPKGGSSLRLITDEGEYIVTAHR